MPFIVRAPATGPTSKILFKYDFLTSQAYNYWGGGSLYSDSQDPLLTVSDTIAIDRPMWYPLSKTVKHGYANDFIKALEDSGMVMDYCNNIDIDSLGVSFLSGYKTIVLWEHDECWSQRERNETEKFIGRHNSGLHGNLARFSANTCYWRIEWLTVRTPNRFFIGDTVSMQRERQDADAADDREHHEPFLGEKNTSAACTLRPSLRCAGNRTSSWTETSVFCPGKNR